MNEKTKQALLKDYKHVNENIERILNEGKNGFVLSSDYVSPRVNLNKCVPIRSSNGEFAYLSRVRGIIEYVFVGHVADSVAVSSEDLMSINAPKYLTNLIK